MTDNEICESVHPLLPHYSPRWRNISSRSVRFWRTLSYFLFCIFFLHGPQYQVRFVLSCFQSDTPPVSNWLTMTMFQSCDHPDEEFDSTGHVETTVLHSWSSLLLCGLLHASDPGCTDCGSRRLHSCLRLQYVCSSISLGEVSVHTHFLCLVILGYLDATFVAVVCTGSISQLPCGVIFSCGVTQTVSKFSYIESVNVIETYWPI